MNRRCDEYDKCKMYKSNPSLIRGEQIEDGKIVIISYDLIRYEEKVLKKQDFDVWILDEATGRSGIKNSSCLAFKKLKAIK